MICSTCGAGLPANAAFCLSCGIRVMPLRQPNHRVFLSIGALVMVGFLVQGLLGHGTAPVGRPVGASPVNTSNDDLMAQVVCEKWVKKSLKAPATAQFDTPTRSSLGGSRYHISGPVDAQNGFGALIRNTYDCTVAFTGGDTYRIETLELHEP